MKTDELALYAWIVRGSQRVKVLKALSKPMTPKMVAQESGLKFSNASDTLRAMRERGLVACLNPKEKTGRLYATTAKGAKLRARI